VADAEVVALTAVNSDGDADRASIVAAEETGPLVAKREMTPHKLKG
jgi:hypothetical protein